MSSLTEHRRNPGPGDIVGIAIPVVIGIVAINLLYKTQNSTGGAKGSGIQISNVQYYTPVLSGADQDFHITLRHKGNAGTYKITVTLTTGNSIVTSLFGNKGDAVWEQFLYIALPENADWATFDYHVTGRLNLDHLRTYNIHTEIQDPGGGVITDEWRNGAIYIL